MTKQSSLPTVPTMAGLRDGKEVVRMFNSADGIRHILSAIRAIFEARAIGSVAGMRQPMAIVDCSCHLLVTTLTDR